MERESNKHNGRTTSGNRADIWLQNSPEMTTETRRRKRNNQKGHPTEQPSIVFIRIKKKERDAKGMKALLLHGV